MNKKYLVPYHIARKLYDLGYKDNTEYSYPVTKQGTLYKNSSQEPYIHVKCDHEEVNSTYYYGNDLQVGTNFNENRLAAPTVLEVQDWLLNNYNILIDCYTYNSRGDYQNCKWFIDINKKPISYSNGSKQFFNSRLIGIQYAIERVVNYLITDLKD